MKTIKAILAVILFFTATVKAQNKTEGIISYEMIMNVYESLTKEQMIYKSMIPETVKTNITLFFKGGNYRMEMQQPKNNEDDGVVISIPMENSNQIVLNDKQLVYTLYKKDATTYYTENKIKTETFVIDEKSVRKLMGYNCYKVIYKSSTKESYELWVTNDLKISCNPMVAGVVAGAVLEINSKKVKYKATKIDLKPQDSKKFEIPTTYKKITNEQAEDLQEELTEKK